MQGNKIYKYDKLTICVVREYANIQPLEQILYKLIMRDIRNMENTADCA